MRASWLTYQQDFDDQSAAKWEDALHISEPGKITVTFEEGQYKLGTTDESSVEEHLIRGTGEEELDLDEDMLRKPSAEAGELELINPYEEPVSVPTDAEVALSEVPTEEAIDAGVPPLAGAGGVVESGVEVEATEAPELTEEAVAEAQEKYDKAWGPVVDKMNNLMKPENTVTTSDKSRDFVANIADHLKKSSELDTNDSELVSVLSSKAASSEQVSDAVRGGILAVLPKEADVLLTEVQPSDVRPIVLDGGSSAVKLIDPSTKKVFFIYDLDYTFLENESEEVIAKQGGVEYIVKPSFSGDKLELEYIEK
jgi:hypothetical protein